MLSAAARDQATAAVSDDGLTITVTAALPGLRKASDADLEVSETLLRIRSLLAEVPHFVEVKLPRSVDPASSTARWSRRGQQLTVQLQART